MNGIYLGGVILANLQSAIKRVSSNESKRLQNEAFKSDMRTQIKKVESLVEANDAENAKTAFQVAVKKIDKTIQKGVIHSNNGNRQKARLAKKLKSLSA